MTARVRTLPPIAVDVPDEADDHPFRYGYRWREVTKEDGTTGIDQVPLTLEDLLHPQEGDHFAETPQHRAECTYLANVFESRKDRLRRGMITQDTLIDWGVPDVRSMSPDVAVLEVVEDESAWWTAGTIPLPDTGGDCLMTLEVVSPRWRKNDVVDKWDLYFRVGVPRYIIVDQERRRGSRRLREFLPAPGGYREIPVDEKIGVEVPELGLRILLIDGELVCRDLDTGVTISSYAEVSRALRQEAEARRKAETLSRQEAKARKQAEQRSRKEAEARRQAEKQSRQEAKARQAAEQRIREMEEELRRLRGDK